MSWPPKYTEQEIASTWLYLSGWAKRWLTDPFRPLHVPRDCDFLATDDGYITCFGMHVMRYGRKQMEG